MKYLYAAFSAVGLLLVVGVLLFILGVPFNQSYRLLFEGALGDRFALSQSVVRATPLLICGVGIVIAWRSGAYSIGAEGQLLVGALFGASVGKLLLPVSVGAFGTILILTSSAIGGMLWSAVAGWLYLKRGVDIVISTILLNFIGDKLLMFAVEGPLRKSGQTSPITDQLPQALMLWKPSRQMDLHLGVFIAVFIALGAAFWLVQTKSGYLARVVGSNPRFVRAQRLDPDAIKFRSMLLSGAICGLAGGVQYLGINGQISSSFSQQYGFLAIPVALLGGLNPVALIPSALFFGGLFAGTSNLARFGGIGNYFVYMVQALAVLGLIAYRYIRSSKETATA